MKKIISMFCLISFVSACSSSNNADQSITAGPSSSPPAPSGDPANNPDMSGFALEVDMNKDGKLSRAEWKAKSLPDSSFNAFEKGRGFVTLEDYQKNAAPPGIDLNNDGKLTVLEFIAFDKQMSKNMPPPPK